MSSNEIRSRFFLPDPFNACLSSFSSLPARERPFRPSGSRRSIGLLLTFSNCRRHIIGVLAGGASCPQENHGTNIIALMRGRVPPIILLQRSLKVTGLDNPSGLRVILLNVHSSCTLQLSHWPVAVARDFHHRSCSRGTPRSEGSHTNLLTALDGMGSSERRQALFVPLGESLDFWPKFTGGFCK